MQSDVVEIYRAEMDIAQRQWAQHGLWDENFLGQCPYTTLPDSDVVPMLPACPYSYATMLEQYASVAAKMGFPVLEYVFFRFLSASAFWVALEELPLWNSGILISDRAMRYRVASGDTRYFAEEETRKFPEKISARG